MSDGFPIRSGMTIGGLGWIPIYIGMDGARFFAALGMTVGEWIPAIAGMEKRNNPHPEIASSTS